MPNPVLAVRTTSGVTAKTSAYLSELAHPQLDARVNALMSELGIAKLAIDKKYAELNQAPGQAIGEVEYGPGGAFLRRFQNGVIYFRAPGAPCWVHGAILAEYLALGADGGFLGYPTTDERATSDATGRYNHFENGSIFWSYQTGAHEVHGAIRDKWAALGWEKSWLGFPLSGERGLTDDGRCSQFQRGFIYWWPDAGAYDLGNVTLRYKGLYCFDETTFDAFSDSDEPYAVMGVVPVPAYPGEPIPPSVRSQIYDDVDSGDSRPDDLEIYRGNAHGAMLGLALCEHGTGDPDTYRSLIQQAVDLAGKAVSAGCGVLFGPEAAPVCESTWAKMAPMIVSTLNDIAGTGERQLGANTLQISAKQMVMLARQPKTPFWGIEYHFGSEFFTRYGAKYQLFFAIEPA